MMSRNKKSRTSGKKRALLALVILLSLLAMTGCAALESAAESGDLVAGILGDRSASINIMLLLTVLSLLPSILIMLTCFVRIVIVLSLVRNGMGVNSMPPNQVIIGLSLFLTFFVMSPVVSEIQTEAYEPYIAEQIELDEAIERGSAPLRNFMLRQTYKSDLAFFVNASGEEIVLNEEAETNEEIFENIPMKALIPAFITSEIKHGFLIGFVIYIPFIVIDMVVASTLMAMGMMMLPPVVISLPFKILLFVLVNGWTLTVETLIGSFK